MSLPNSLVSTMIEGQNAQQFIQGYVTCDMDSVSPECALPMAVTDIKGRVVVSGWTTGSTQQIQLIHLPTASSILEKHLKPYLMFANCKLTHNPDPLFLQESTNQETSQPQITDSNLTFSKESDQAVNLDHFQVEQAFILVGEPTSGQFLPQMLNLTNKDAVSFEKGCYLGQEVVARAEHRGQIKRGIVKVNQDQPADVGSAIDLDDGRKGVVVAVSGNEKLVVTRLHTEEADALA